MPALQTSQCWLCYSFKEDDSVLKAGLFLLLLFTQWWCHCQTPESDHFVSSNTTDRNKAQHCTRVQTPPRNQSYQNNTSDSYHKTNWQAHESLTSPKALRKRIKLDPTPFPALQRSCPGALLPAPDPGAALRCPCPHARHPSPRPARGAEDEPRRWGRRAPTSAPPRLRCTSAAEAS